MATTKGTGFINPQTYAAANAGASRAMQDRLASFLAQGQARFSEGLGDVQQRFGVGLRDGTPGDFYGNGLTAEEAEALGFSTRYTGPGGLSEDSQWGKVLDAGRRAERDGALGADYYGRQALLQQEYGKQGGYTPGMSRFDSFLAGTGGGQGRFDAAKANSRGLSGQAVQADKVAQGEAGAARAQAEATRQQYANAAPGLRQAEEAEVERQRQGTQVQLRKDRSSAVQENRETFKPKRKPGVDGWGGW